MSSSATEVIIPTLSVNVEEIAIALKDGLHDCFSDIKVEIDECPDLCAKPFNLSIKGLQGENVVCDVGSFSYLIPVADKTKRYAFDRVVNSSNISSGQLLGAGAGPFYTAGFNCEMATRLLFRDQEIIENSTLHGIYLKEEKKPSVLRANDNNFAILGQFLATEGNSGKVISITLSHRKKDGSVYTFLREALTSKFGEENAPVALGGIFLLENSKARFHVMPEFPSEPVDTPEKIGSWLKFFEMHPPIVGLGTIVSHDPDNYDLKLEHFHCYNKAGSEAGHFYYDTEPENAVYHFYLVPSSQILRIDRAIK